MKREPKGNGSVSALPTGRWLVKVPVGKTEKGTTRYVTKTCETKAVARRWQSSLLAQRESHELRAGPRQTFKQYAEEVLLNRNDHMSDRTRDGYFRSLRKHVFPTLGSRVLTEVRPQELEQLFSRLRRNRSASTVNNVRVAVSKVFAVAVRHELVVFNPVSRTEKAKRSEYEKTQVRVPWSVDEVRAVIAAAKETPMEPFVTLSLATGARLGEVLGLRWSDINFELQTVSIERTIHRESITQRDGTRVRGVVVKPPKTASSRRVNQLTPPVLDVLRRLELEQRLDRAAVGEMWNEDHYVLTSETGGPLDESNHRKRYKKFLAENGIRYIRIHDLRHTFATVLIEDNPGQLASVSKALGHSNIGITMDTYAKTARVETKATSRMSEILFPNREVAKPIFVDAPGKAPSLRPGHQHAT